MGRVLGWVWLWARVGRALGAQDSLHWMEDSLEVKGAAMLASPSFTMGVLSSSRSRSTWLRRSCGVSSRGQPWLARVMGISNLNTHPVGGWWLLRGQECQPLFG